MEKLLNYSSLIIIIGILSLSSCKKIVVDFYPYEYKLDSITGCSFGKIINNRYYEEIPVSNDSFCIRLKFAFANVSKKPYNGNVKKFVSKIQDIEAFMISSNDTIPIDSLLYYRYLIYPTLDGLSYLENESNLFGYYFTKQSFFYNFPQQYYCNALLVFKNNHITTNVGSVKFKFNISWIENTCQANVVKNVTLYSNYINTN